MYCGFDTLVVSYGKRTDESDDTGIFARTFVGMVLGPNWDTLI